MADNSTTLPGFNPSGDEDVLLLSEQQETGMSEADSYLPSIRISGATTFAVGL